jgi:imidazolonepropionase-like amidohydrolase
LILFASFAIVGRMDIRVKGTAGFILRLFLLSFLAARSFGAEENPIVFVHATVIDATGAPAQPDVTVVITGDRITATGKSAEVSLPANAHIVDATGKFLIPGLWDMHVHWYAKDYLPLFLANGITGIRIMWGMPEHHEWRKEMEQGSLLCPRLFIASAIVDGPKPYWPGSDMAGNEAEGRQAVKKAMQDGADFVKVYSFLPREAYFAIADEAKKQGIPFEGHVPISVSVEEASAAGQKSIEHLTGVLPACSTNAAELLKTAQESLAARLNTNDTGNLAARVAQMREGALALDTYSPEKAEAVFAQFKKNHTFQCPTLTVLHLSAADPSIVTDARIKYMPWEIRSYWSTSDSRFTNRSPETTAFGKKTFQKDLEMVGAMQRAGVDILAGTDTGNPYCFPGFSLHDELGWLVDAGLTPMQALQAATRNAARFMGRENELGTIQQGKLADLILLDANPLDNIANTRKIAAVVYGGRFFPKSSLDEMLAKVEALTKKRTVPDLLLEICTQKGIDAAIQQYHELKSAHSPDMEIKEDDLNNLGYYLIWMKKNKDAIKILKLNAETYPQSANVYDSLAEAYMDDGDKQLAIENYEKSLKLDPKNRSAIEKLKQLNAP